MFNCSTSQFSTQTNLWHMCILSAFWHVHRVSIKKQAKLFLL